MTNVRGVRQQRGVAVVAAMLLAALTTVLVGSLVYSQHLLVAELENHANLTQSWWIDEAGIEWAKIILDEDQKSGPVDHLQETWAKVLPVTAVEGGEVTGSIEDAQRLFNLNNLQDAAKGLDRQSIFGRMLGRLDLPHELAATLSDWIDADSIETANGGAEDDYYLGLSPPYRAANQPLTEMGNLYRIKGFDNAAVDKLSGLATVLPERTPVNVNTAPPDVLLSVLDGADLADVQTLIASRNVAWFTDVGDFAKRIAGGTMKFDENSISVNSTYFLVTCNARFGRANSRMQALIVRRGGRPLTVWKRFG